MTRFQFPPGAGALLSRYRNIGRMYYCQPFAVVLYRHDSAASRATAEGRLSAVPEPDFC